MVTIGEQAWKGQGKERNFFVNFISCLYCFYNENIHLQPVYYFLGSYGV